MEITLPKPGDEISIGPVHRQAWLETYVDAERGVTEQDVEEMIGYTVSEMGINNRKQIMAEVLEKPDQVFYRVARMDDKVVGFIYARKEDAYTEIRAIYLLQEAKGKGLGGRMMDEFLAWADKDKPCSLKIFITNEKTLGFYKKYGFEQTEKLPEKFTDKFLFVEMVKPRV